MSFHVGASHLGSSALSRIFLTRGRRLGRDGVFGLEADFRFGATDRLFAAFGFFPGERRRLGFELFRLAIERASAPRTMNRAVLAQSVIVGATAGA